MKYKGIIFDIDGTAGPLSVKQASSRLQKAITTASKIAKISAATGRSYGPAKPMFVSLGLVHPSILMAGSAIIDPITDEVIWSMPMNVAQTDHALEIIKNYKTDLHMGISAVKPSIRLSEYRKHEHSTHVIYALNMAPKDAKQLVKEASAIGGLVAHTTPSWNIGNTDVHITHEQATKEHAIQKLIEVLELKPEETIGIGDGANDIPIFKAVGHRVAMGNAEQELKDLADEIAPSYKEDGLAQIIEKYFLARL